MTTDAASEQTLDISPHRASFEPPDIIRVFWDGPASAEAINDLYTWSESLFPDGRRYFVIADMTRIDPVDAAARKGAASDPRARRMAGLAIIGASFQLRVVMGMFMKALELFYGDEICRMEFFDLEAEALAWVDAERARRATTSG
jgi:hypothetical protein